MPDTVKSSISFIPHKNPARWVASFLHMNTVGSERLSDMFKYLQVEWNGAGIVVHICLTLHVLLHPFTWKQIGYDQ